jgi:ferritin-like metal-binding protein YciE
MAKVTDPADLFNYKLNVALQSEKVVERALPKLAKEANNEELRRGFERHAEETRGHIENLQQVIGGMGRSPRSTKALVAEALELEHKAFGSEADEMVLPEVLDLVAVGSANATEHYEIATYETLIGLARSLGASEAIPLLEQNLEQERNMLEQTRKIGKRLGAFASGDMEQDLQPSVSQPVGSPSGDRENTAQPSS